MATRAETAALVASLTLDDRGFSKGISSAQKKLGELESTSFRVGQQIGGGLKNAGANLAKLGAIGIAGITVAVKSGLDDLAELENAVTSVDGAIEQLGLTGQLTGKQVADWANDIERDIDAAFDDKAITQAATTLLRFGHVAPDALEPALRVVADLAAKTGDVESASELLSKALADPAKAAGRLTRVGILLTEQQKDQIKAMTEAGDVAGAQALVLDAVAKSTNGAAKAMAGPYQDALNKTNDAVEDARKALAVGFLPIITKVADKLSNIAADPKALASIEEFGKTLASGLDDLIDIAERLPWDAIGSSLQIAGAGAKAVLNAFVSLPPWVQTAVLTGWGLNKLTGGALTGIAGEIAKGLIGSKLGERGGTPANPLFVKDIGLGAGGVPGAATAATGLTAAAVGTAGVGVIILGASQKFLAGLSGGIATAVTGDAGKGAAVEALQTGTSVGSPIPILGPLDRLFRGLSGDFRSAAEVAADAAGEGTAATKNVGVFVQQAASDAASRQNITNERLEAINASQAKIDATTAAVHNATAQEIAIGAQNQAAAFSIRDGVASSKAVVAAAVDRVAAAANATRSAAAAAGQQTAAAIRDKDLSVTVQNHNVVNTSVSVRETINGQTTFKSFFKTLS